MINNKGKILIIDDEVDFAYLLSKRIKMEGYEVAYYHQGDSAIETSKNVKPNLILLDINLPDISGFEVYSNLKNNKEVSSIPVIFLSAMHDKEQHCLESLKAQGFLKKPCDGKIILQTIEKNLSNRL